MVMCGSQVELLGVFRGSDGEYWEGCNEEYHRGVFGCRFGELPLRESKRIRISLSVWSGRSNLVRMVSGQAFFRSGPFKCSAYPFTYVLSVCVVR